MSRGQHTLAWLANQLRVDQPAQLGSWVWRLFVYRSAATPWQPVQAGEVSDPLQWLARHLDVPRNASLWQWLLRLVVRPGPAPGTLTPAMRAISWVLHAVGWLLHRTVGGLVAGTLFVLPGALVMLCLSSFYMLYNDAPVIEALFFGVKAAVLAVVVEAVIRIGKRALKNHMMVAIAVAAFLAIYVVKLPFPLIILLAGLTGWIGNRFAPALFSGSSHGKGNVPDIRGAVDLMFERGELDHTRPTKWHAPRTIAIWLPVWLGPVALIAALTGSASVWTQLGSFFSVMAVVTLRRGHPVSRLCAQ